MLSTFGRRRGQQHRDLKKRRAKGWEGEGERKEARTSKLRKKEEKGRKENRFFIQDRASYNVIMLRRCAVIIKEYVVRIVVKIKGNGTSEFRRCREGSLNTAYVSASVLL